MFSTRTGLLIFLCQTLRPTTARTHSLITTETSSFHIPDVPDYVSVTQLNDVQMAYYNGKDTLKYTDQWKAAGKDPAFVAKETKDSSVYKVWARIIFEDILRDLNETQGAHVCQMISGCDWDDETEKRSAVLHFGLDGEGFISLDKEKEEWIAVTPRAQIIAARWNRFLDKGFVKHVFYGDCVAKLKHYLSYGQHTLRTELPLVSLLQKSSSAPVTCHATGFYPDRALLFWTKDGHELMEDEDVDHGEILPNGDGTFQTSVSLDLSSVPPEDWDRFHCVFHLSGVQDDYVTRLDRTKIRTNIRTDITTDIRTNIRTNFRTNITTDIRTDAKAPPACTITAVVLGVVFIVSAAAAAAAVVLFVTRRRKAQNNPQQDAQMRLNPNPVVQATNSSPDAETQTLNPESSE